MATLSDSPRATSFIGAACLAAVLLAVFFIATLLGQDPARQTIGWASAYTVFGIAPPLVLSLLEHLTRPAGPRKSAQKWLLHFQIMLANYAAAVPLGLLAAYLATFLVKSLGLNLGLVDLRIGTGKEIISIAAGFLLSALLGDFFFYWYHRCLHRSNILWQHHKMHHLDPEFDALTGPRQNWLENFFLVFFNIIPMAVLFKFNDLDPLDAGLIQGTVVGLLLLLQFQNHSNLRLQFGRASLVFTSSQTHRIHHSYLLQHRDKNFVAFFPIWDVLFGTYYHPGRDEFPLTGVADESDIQSVWEAQIYPLREWWKLWRTHRRRTSSG
jgi:sterol desaturase/sphingolipid hydroxylase (fatty acid hydroxylase superfamily)